MLAADWGLQNCSGLQWLDLLALHVLNHLALTAALISLKQAIQPAARRRFDNQCQSRKPNIEHGFDLAMNFKVLKTGKLVLSFLFVADKTEMGGADDMTYTFKVSIILKKYII